MENNAANNHKGALLKLFALLLAGIILSSIIQYQILGNQNQEDAITLNPKQYLYSIALFQIIAFLLPALIWLKHIGLSISRKALITQPKKVGLAIVLFIITYILANYLNVFTEKIIETYFPVLYKEIATQYARYQLLFQNNDSLLWSIVVIGIIPAIAEELFFRAAIFGFLEKKLNSFWHAALLSSLFFAGVHLQLTQFLPIFLLGLSLTIAYKYTGSIYIPILLHALNNTVQILLIRYEINWI